MGLSALDIGRYRTEVKIYNQLPPNKLGGLSLKVSNMLKKVPRNDRPVDVGPCSDIDRRDVVGMASVATADTPEQISLRPISPLIDSTDGADMACTPRIDGYNLNPIKFGLVFDKLPELVESPRMQTTTLRPTSRDPFSDALEVFKGYPSMGAFGLSHYILGDDMVHVPLEPRLFTREMFEMSLRALGSTALKVGFEFVVSLPDFINLFSRVVFPIAVVGEILQTQINTQCSDRIKKRFFWGVDGDCEVEYAVSEKEISLSFESVHSSLLVFSYPDVDLDTAFEGENRGVFETLPAENPLIVYHCPVGLELAEYILVSLVGFNDLTYGSNCHLCRESVLLPDPIVDELVEGPVIGESIMVGYLSYVVTGLVESLHSFQKGIMLLLVWREFYQERKLHHSMEEDTPYLNNITLRFLHPLKWVVSTEVTR